MFSSLSPNAVRPCMPLRKPASSPFALCASPRQVIVSNGAPVNPSGSANGISPVNLPVCRDTSVESRSMSQVNLCNYCGQQGCFRCKRCKNTTYCSVACQTEDWKAHRHMCVSVDPEPAKLTPNDTEALPVAGERAGLLVSQGDASSLQRVYLKNLHMTKFIKATDIQFKASVVEFYSPGRFFLLAQSPEVLTTLQSISTELQKMHNSPSVSTYIPCVGEVCAVQFSCDLNWYRGLVQTLATNQKTANILYIDFGNEEDVPVDRIKPLAANMEPLCPCAMECRIARVVPVVGNWSDICCVAVRQLLANKTVTVRLVESVEHSHIHIVDIMLPMGKQLSTFLIEQGYAAEEIVNITPTEQEIQAMVNASLENFRRLSDGKDDNIWAQPPEPLTQAVGDTFAVVVTHLQSPSEMIVQKVENAGAIQELQLKLREHCSQVTAPQNFRPAPGTVCCAQFSEDKQWYRAKVLAYSSEENVCIGYLDFGNSEEVDLSHLRPISPSLLSLPMQAMPCGLAGVQPLGESWSEDCVLALQLRVSNRILHIEIQGEQEGKALVAMIDEASDPQANVAELLIFAGFAVPAPVNRSSDQQAEQTPATDTEQHVSTPACEPLVWSYAELPRNGKVSLQITKVKNPHEFYCYIDNPTDRQRLTELEAEMKEHCKVNASTFEPKVGEPCCAMFPGHDHRAWYRAMVNGLSEDKVSVNFVDYGYCMEVEKNLLRSITPRLLALPYQAICCSLAGVEPMGSEWSSEAVLVFQTLIADQQLSACVVSVSDQGYNVKLENRGQDVAAALISEQLVKAPGAIPKETHATTGSEVKYQEKMNENELSQIHVPNSNHTEASSKEMPTETTATPSEAPSFPVDWKTVRLPLNEIFQPYITAVINPSQFYLIFPSQVNQEKLQAVMTDLTTYCNKASSSSAVMSTPAPGAACCAQFSADNNWYRAVVLEVGETHMSVIYADYGNTEKVPVSRILPIPMHLLQHPFQITRCTLTGKEHFPAVWPEDLKPIFQSLLLNCGLATVESFDGSANVLSLTLLSEKGGGHLTTTILDALQDWAKSNPSPTTTQKVEETDSSTSCASAAVVPECPQPKSIPETQKVPENTANTAAQTVTPEPAHWTPEQKTSTCAMSFNEDPVQKIVVQMEPPCTGPTLTTDPPTSSCCCLSLKTKIDQLEQLARVQLSLIEQLVGQKK